MQWRIQIGNKIFTATLKTFSDGGRGIHVNTSPGAFPHFLIVPDGRFARDVLNATFPDATIWPVTYTGHVTR